MTKHLAGHQLKQPHNITRLSFEEFVPEVVEGAVGPGDREVVILVVLDVVVIKGSRGR